MQPDSTEDFDFEAFAKISLATSFRYFLTMEKALGADTRRYLKKCVELASSREDGTPIGSDQYAELGFWYRGLARAFLTYVEGLLFMMRRIVIYAEERHEISLSTAEGTLVRELEYSMNPRRKRIEERSKPNRFLENFVLTFKLFPQVFGSKYQIDYGDDGWEKMQRVVKYRNDITHPKSPQDTLLAPEAPNLIRDASTWFFECMSQLVSSVDAEKLDRNMKETVKMPEMQRILLDRRTD